jgi:plasmid replication initiation protein
MTAHLGEKTSVREMLRHSVQRPQKVPADGLQASRDESDPLALVHESPNTLLCSDAVAGASRRGHLDDHRESVEAGLLEAGRWHGLGRGGRVRNW